MFFMPVRRNVPGALAWNVQRFPADFGFANRRILLLLVFAFADAFEHGEPGFFGIGDGQGLEFDG
jgi:hypothetical protein